MSTPLTAVVTGAAGRLGSRVVDELTRRGHRPVAVDRSPSRRDRGVPWHVIDVRDQAALVDACRAADAIIHCGAIPDPTQHAPSDVFLNNVGATFSVVTAAEVTAIGRVVAASSVSILGGAWADPHVAPDYAPVDEAHPLRPEDPYGLGKVVDELVCSYFARRRPSARVAALRFHWVLDDSDLAAAVAGVARDPASMAHLLWGYVHVEDAAAACVDAIERAPVGVTVANITAADTLAEAATEEMITRWSPATRVRSAIPGTSTAWSLRAAEAFGYRPRVSWRDNR